MDILLTQGKATPVDDVDADLASMKWHADTDKKSKTVYAKRNVLKADGKTYTRIGLHQVIASRMGIVGPPDHLDRDGLNNRRSNLRAARGHNQANVALRKDNTSGFKGVSVRKPGTWSAYIYVGGKQKRLGSFPDPFEAAKAYDRAALEAFGEFAVLNFPVPASQRLPNR